METRFMRRIEGKTRRNRIKNETNKKQLQIEPIYNKVMEGQAKWFGHALRN